MSFSPSARVSRIAISATKQMPMLAAKVGGCVSLGQGVPSFQAPHHVREAVCKAIMDDPVAGKYSLQPGMLELREAIGAEIMATKGALYAADGEIGVMAGAMEALLCTMLTLVEKGDEVVLLSPCYPSHVEQIVLAGGKPVFAELIEDADGWKLDVDAVRAVLSPRTKAIVVNSPSNPTGAVFAESDLRELGILARNHGMYVVCDDTYDYLTYAGPAFSMASMRELRDRLILVHSFSKKFALTGWRVGYACAPAEIMAELLKVHDCATICAPAVSQIAALAALQGPQEVYGEFLDALQRRRDLTCERLDAIDGFSYAKPEGAFYVMAKYEGGAPSLEIAKRIIREAKVITVPGASFGPGGEGHLRMSFGGDENEINEAFERIGNWVRAGGLHTQGE